MNLSCLLHNLNIKSRDVQMYNIYSIAETMVGKTKSVAIVDLVHVCSDISSIKRAPAYGMA